MTWRDLLDAAEAVRAVVAERDASVAGMPLAGVGWATVEHERTVRELDAALGAGGSGEAGGVEWAPGSWTPLPRDPVLGASAWHRVAAGSPGRPALVVLEPDTEGRIAASLARWGEGVAVIYLGNGPAGPGRLVRGGPAWGPHVVVVGDAG